MAWVRIDEEFYDHPRWAEAPGDSIALWLAAMAWCNRNEQWSGSIPVEALVSLVNVRRQRATIHDLENRGAIRRDGQMYVLDLEDDASLCPQSRRRCHLSATVRQQVYDRDGHRCLECGATKNLTLDHIRPWSRGGSDHITNLRTLCRPCNSRKGARLP